MQVPWNGRGKIKLAILRTKFLRWNSSNILDHISPFCCVGPEPDRGDDQPGFRVIWRRGRGAESGLETEEGRRLPGGGGHHPEQRVQAHLGGGVQRGQEDSGPEGGDGDRVRWQGGHGLQDCPDGLPGVPKVRYLLPSSKNIIRDNAIVSLGIAGGPGKAYEECGMVMRNLCEDVPNQKNVTAEVETCIQSPKEVIKT